MMKVVGKEIIPRKENVKNGLNVSASKHKGLSKSLSKPVKLQDIPGGTPGKKTKELKVIKESVKKKKEDKKDK